MPLQERGRGVEHARVYDMPPPVGGWNARDSLSDMPDTDAVLLRNWFPQQGNVVTRPGYKQTALAPASGVGQVTQLIPFEYASYSMLISQVGSSIQAFSVTADGALTGSHIRGSTASVTVGSGALSFDYLGGYVHMASPGVAPCAFQGTAFSYPSWTGVTLTTLTQVSVYKSRVYFVEQNSQSMWYGGVGSVTGALTEFNFATVAAVRGNLMFTTHLKGDGGDGGVDDVFVAVFDDGDVLSYTGSDPGSDFSIVGHYRIGRPVSRVSFVSAADDVYVVTDRGYEKLSQVLQYGDAAPEKAMLSEKIQRGVSKLLTATGDSASNLTRWRFCTYSRGQMLIIQVPDVVQHVMNLTTGSWCEFTGISAASWAVVGGNCFFGHLTDGYVYQFDPKEVEAGTYLFEQPYRYSADGVGTDTSTEITSDCISAWSRMGSSSVKAASLIQPRFIAQAKPKTAVAVYGDYYVTKESVVAGLSFTVTEETGSAIDYDGIVESHLFDVFPPSSQTIFQKIYSRSATGSRMAIRMRVKTGGHDSEGSRIFWSRVEWLGTKVTSNISGLGHARGNQVRGSS